MASAEIKTNESPFKVRPGLLLSFVVVLALAICEKTAIAASLTSGPETAKRAILFLAAISTAYGWFLLWKEPNGNDSKRKWLTIAAAAVLTISIGDYVSYTVVPVKYILAFHLLSRVTDLLDRWQVALAALALIGPFFARGRSRLSLVVGGTLMLLLWNAAWGQSFQSSLRSQLPRQLDSYDVVLHSASVEEQRTALTAVLRSPQLYVPRIRRSLQNYPGSLRTDRTAANRAVYVGALVRDPSFAPILANILGDANVLSECEYACPVVFALTIDAYFAGWNPPSGLDTKLMTVTDLQAEIRHVRSIILQIKPIEDVVQGPALEQHKKEIEGKSEEELIRMAGPGTPSYETRVFAAYRLETSVLTGKNRIDLYLLAINEIRDASGEYRGAVYESIYRAELANAGAKSR
jgi:hypothetical protein